MTWCDRLRQGVQALLPAEPPAERDTIITAILTPEQAVAFRQLPAFDQRHLIRVYQRLCSAGERDKDVLLAALLHDIGKVGPEGRVRLPHRVARVLLRRIAPGLLAWLARRPAPRWRAGFALAVHHPALGAERAASLGCSERVCWLIAHHEDDPPAPDSALCRLIAADRAE